MKPDPTTAFEDLASGVAGPAAAAVDASGEFPRAAIDAAADLRLLGALISSDVGGLGWALGDVAAGVRRVAASCGSTAMVLCMHYSATAVIDQHGDRTTREAVAAARHLSTLAFSEVGSRSQFWAPLGTARADGDHVRLDAQKSWVTSAGEVESYVWTSRPVAADEGATLWLVPANSPGLTITGGFDGLGLRGNGSRPITADGVRIDRSNALGGDGEGLDIALGVALPVFQILSAACSLGFIDGAVTKSVAHVGTARFEHLGETLADQPVVRQHIAAMQNRGDAAAALVTDGIAALRDGRDDAPLRMLQAKEVAAEAALEVVDIAMRVGGGAAFRKDIGIERHFRDARAAAVMAPTSDVLRDMIGRAVCGLPLLG